jgi:hypothetical protein
MCTKYILRVKLRDIFKNRWVTAMIESYVYKNLLQRAGWGSPRPFFIYIYFICQIKKRQPQSCSVQITWSPHSLANPEQRTWVREGRVVRTPESGGKWCAVYRAGEGVRPGRWPRGLRKTKIEPTDSVETFASPKSRKVSSYFCFCKK